VQSVAKKREYYIVKVYNTMSANSHWPEIEDALLPEQRPEHCPDLICYVFHAKWNEFIQNIKGGCFENSV